MREFRESDHAFGNASRFRGGLDFGPNALRAAGAEAVAARAVWRVRKLPPVTVRGAVKEFCRSDQRCRNASGSSDFVSRTSVHHAKFSKSTIDATDFGPRHGLRSNT